MALPVKTEYVIQILKQGDGAAQSVADFQKVQAAAAGANTQIANTAKQSAQNMQQAGGVIRNALGLLTTTAFPQAAGAAATFSQSLNVVQGSATRLGGAVATANVAMIALAVGITATTLVTKIFNDRIEETKKKLDEAAKNQKAFNDLRLQIEQMGRSGQLTAEKVAELNRRLGDTVKLRGELTAENLEAEKKMLEALARQVKLEEDFDALRREIHNDTLRGIDLEMAKNKDKHDAQMAQLEKLQAELKKIAALPAPFVLVPQPPPSGSKHNLLQSVTGPVPQTSPASGQQKFQLLSAIPSPENAEDALRKKAEQDFANRQVEIQEAANEKITQDAIEAENKRLAERKRGLNDAVGAMLDAAEEDKSSAKAVREFEASLTADTLTDQERVQFVIQQNFEERLKHIQELRAAGKITSEQEIADINKATAAMKKQQFEASQLGQTLEFAAQQFSSGFSSAFVDFVSGTKSAEEAFKQFASTFLRAVADMIMQTIILNAVKAGLNAIAGGSGSATQYIGTATAVAAGAQGGMFPRMMAFGGIQTVGQPTYFPRFNVVTGEAGPEMLTVLSRPRMMQLGGVEAAVGNAGPQRLAITDAAALERGGRAGSAEVLIRLSPGLEASIVQNSIEGARVRVVRDMREDSELSQTTRKLVS